MEFLAAAQEEIDPPPLWISKLYYRSAAYQTELYNRVGVSAGNGYVKADPSLTEISGGEKGSKPIHNHQERSEHWCTGILRLMLYQIAKS